MPPMKWVIMDQELYWGRAWYHADLIKSDLKSDSVVAGGGYFTYNREEKTFLFYGSSEQYGASNQNLLRQALESADDLQSRFPGYTFFYSEDSYPETPNYSFL